MVVDTTLIEYKVQFTYHIICRLHQLFFIELRGINKPMKPTDAELTTLTCTCIIIISDTKCRQTYIQFG